MLCEISPGLTVLAGSTGCTQCEFTMCSLNAARMERPVRVRKPLRHVGVVTSVDRKWSHIRERSSVSKMTTAYRDPFQKLDKRECEVCLCSEPCSGREQIVGFCRQATKQPNCPACTRVKRSITKTLRSWPVASGQFRVGRLRPPTSRCAHR